jgi:TP901 family phage tail tape measure protein
MSGVSLGSAYGSIEIRTDGVTKGVRAAVAALRDFEAQTSGTGRNLDQIGAAGQRAGNQVARGAQEATRGIRDLARSTQDVSGAFDTMAGTAAVLGGSLAAGLGLAVKSASDLETAVARVSTIAPEIDTGRVTAELSAMSTEVAQTSTQLAASLNNIFSSIETNQQDALKLTEQFGRGAVAAGTDAETFGTAILGVLNAYGLSVDNASHLSDVFFNTLKVGVVNGDELARGLGQVTQTAKLAGVNFDTLGALIAGVTREGGSAETSINNLANALNKITTAETQKGLAALGIQTKDASGNFRDIIAVLGDLDAKLRTLSAGDRSRVLQELFPDAQARAGISTLLSQLDTVRGALEDNANAAGVANAAYEKMANTAAAQGQLLRNTLTATLVQLGNIALPNLVGLAENTRGVVAAFGELPRGMQSAIVNGALVSAGFLLIGSGALKATSTVIQLAGALRTLAGAMATANTASKGLIGTLGAIAGGVLIFESAMKAAGRVSLIDVIPSLIRYGDALGQGREEAEKFFKAHEGEDAAKRSRALETRRAQIEEEIRLLDEATEARKKFTLGNFLESANPFGETPWDNNIKADNLRKELEEISRLMNLIDHGFASDPFAFREDARLTGTALAPEQVQAQVTAVNALSAAFGKNAQQADAMALGQQRAAAVASQLAGGLGQVATAFGQAGQSSQVAATGFGAAEAAARRLGGVIPLLDAALTAQSEGMQRVTSATAPLQAALDQVAAKQAAGIPLTQQEANLWQQIPGYLGEAESALNSLALAQAQTAINSINARGGINAIGGEFAGAAGQASGLTGEINRLSGALKQLQASQTALSAEDAQLTDMYNRFKARADALEQQKKDAGGFLPPDLQAELDDYNRRLGLISEQLGVNAAKERENAKAIQDGTAAREAAIIAQQKQDEATANDPFTWREDRRTAVGADIPPPPPPVAVDLVAKLDDGALETARKALGEPVKVPLQLEQAKGMATGASAAAAAMNLDLNAPLTQKVVVTADTSAAVTALDGITKALDTIGAAAPNPTVSVNDQATGIAQGITRAVDDIPDTSRTEATAADFATPVLGGIALAVEGIPKSFTITANVDTSGALAAIANLRANMPSSPAEKGPFRTLPDWGSVFSSLAPAGEEAVSTIEETTAGMAYAIAEGIDAATDEGASAAADLASKVAGAVEATADAMARLREFRAPDPRQFEKLRGSLLPILDAFAADAAGRGDLEAANGWADHVGKVVSAVSGGVDALVKLRDFKRPSDRAIEDFRDASQYLVRVLSQVAADSDQGLTEAGAKWAEAAGKVFAGVSSGVDALVKLQDFRRPTDRAVTDFRDVAQFVVNLMAQVAADIEDQALPKASDWADTAGKIFSAVGTGVDALTKLQDFERPTDQAVESFRDVSQYAVNLLAQVAADIEDQALPKAEAWGTTAIAVFGAIADGVDALTKLHDFERPTDQALRSFRDVAQLAVNLIAEVAAVTDGQMLEDAATYSEAAGKVLSLIGSGVGALGKLGEEEFRPPDQTTLDRIAESTRQAVVAVGTAARAVETELVEEAGTYSEGAGKAVALIGSGFAAFSEIASFVPPSQAQIDGVVAATAHTIRQLAAAAAQMDAEVVKAAGEYGESGSRAIGVVGATLSAFGNMKDWVAPSREGIDAVVSVTNYAVGQLAGIAQQYDPRTLERLGQFGENAGSAIGALRGALDLGEVFKEEGRVKPADALGTALGEFQAGLPVLGELVTTSETYKNQAAIFGANMAQAYTDIASALPGFYPAQAAAAAEVIVGAGQQTIVHRYEGTIRFEMMAENGQWIARSLDADDVARRETAVMLFDEFLDGAGAES